MADDRDRDPPELPRLTRSPDRSPRPMALHVRPPEQADLPTAQPPRPPSGEAYASESAAGDIFEPRSPLPPLSETLSRIFMTSPPGPHPPRPSPPAAPYRALSPTSPHKYQRVDSGIRYDYHPPLPPPAALLRRPFGRAASLSPTRRRLTGLPPADVPPRPPSAFSPSPYPTGEYAPAGPSGTGTPYLRETRARQQRALTASHPYAVAPPNDKPYGFSMAMGGSYEATRSAYEPPKVYSFVPIPGINTKKRPRRRYDEIDRVYGCNHPGCDKSYGTLNHLNAHIVMHKHGPKRHPSEFKDVRRNLRRAKAPAGNPLVDSAVGSPSSPHEASEGEGASPSAKPPGKPPSPTNSV